MNLAKNLRTLRTERGLSARAVSTAAGLSPSCVRQIEAQQIASPRLETLGRIATALDVSLATLLGEK